MAALDWVKFKFGCTDTLTMPSQYPRTQQHCRLGKLLWPFVKPDVQLYLPPSRSSLSQLMLHRRRHLLLEGSERPADYFFGF